MFSSLKVTRWAFSASAVALALGLASCGPQAANSPPPATTGASPAATSGGGGTISINGAGATAPEPIYQRWFSEYGSQNPNVQISYQGVGSGAGIKQFNAKTVDFGATDAPLKDDERKAYPSDRGSAPIQIPSTGLFVVFAHNLEGVDDLKLSRTSYCGIADGSIKTWNDPKIVKDNPGAKLPSEPIVWVYRSDGSGTTSIFTKHLEKACPGWKIGSGKTVEWTSGTGAKGNPGVTAQIQQTKGAIGYTEYSFAKENGLKMATLQNKAGDFITPAPEAAAKALEGAKVGEDLSIKVPDPEAKGAYPIVSLTYLLLYEKYDQPEKAEALKKVITWAISDGSKAATELGYIPLPADVVTKVTAAIDTIKVASK